MRRTQLFLIIGLAALLLDAGTAAAQQIENAFVIIIDGLRDDEGFESESLYLRHIWNDLRPVGTINTRFWNRGWTATTGGHATILSGARQVIPNNGGKSQDIRSFDPLAFEYYRQHRGAPESDCGVVVGKWGNCGAIADFGLEPAFGERFRGFQLRDTTDLSDTTTCRLVHLALDSLRPRLMLVNLRDVDSYGHAGVFDDYLQAIRAADSVVYDIYRRIQALPPYTDTTYRDKTLLLVTSDHGRNDDAHGGFKGHGEWDHGCRDILFYAFGPDIARGRTVERDRGQIDILPTVGAALGFPTPFAEGDVMVEIFEPGMVPLPPRATPAAVSLGNISRNDGFSRDPDICRDRYGNLHLVWSDNTPGRWSVLYARSTDEGVSWSAPRTMFDYPAEDSVMWYARVAADDSVSIAATGWARHACTVDSLNPTLLDTTFLWYPWVAASADGGLSWRATSLLDSSMGTYYPAVTLRDGRSSVAWWACGTLRSDTLGNGTQFNWRGPGEDWQPGSVRIDGKKAVHLAMADDGLLRHIGAGVLKSQDWDIGYFVSEDGASWTKTWVTDDPAEEPVYDLDPELVVDDTGMVHLFWARKDNTGGSWQLMYGRRNPATGEWDTLSLGSTPADAWQPHAAMKGDTIALVWTDYRDGKPEVYQRSSIDRGESWSLPVRLTNTAGLVHRPRVCPLAEGFIVVWQQHDGVQWDIHSSALPTALHERRVPEPRRPGLPTVLRGPELARLAGRLYDACGRAQRTDRPGPGVYFIASRAGVGEMDVRKIVIVP